MNLRSTIQHFFTQCGLDKTYWIAYSGGLDSSVLLSLCADMRLELPLKLRAIHINHGLSGDAQKWAQHCEAICQHYSIDYINQTIQIDLCAGESLEEVARNKRYAIFAEYMQENDVLLTAHHQDDQAETFLLQLLRGAGTKGLAAMPSIKNFARGLHVRPLLNFSRATLEEYADQHQLTWIDDESNANEKLNRNFLRHQIFASLKQRFPSVHTTIARSATHCAEAEELLGILAQEKIQNISGSRANTLSVSKLRQLAPAIQRLVLRYWISSRNFSLPGTKKINTILQQVLTANWDKLPSLNWGDVELKRYRDDLFLLPVLPTQKCKQSIAWNFVKTLPLPNIGYLHAELQQGRGLRIESTNNCYVRFRQGGEVIRLAQRGTKTLKNLFHEWGILPWERDRVPLIFIEDELVAVPGRCVAENYAASEKEPGYVFKLAPEIE